MGIDGGFLSVEGIHCRRSLWYRPQQHGWSPMTTCELTHF